MAKKKVLVIGQENLTRGGIQSVIMSILRSLHEEYTFDIILLRDEKKDYDDEFLSYGGKIFHCPTYQGTNRTRQRGDFYVRGGKLCRFTRKIIRENGPYQVIHCHAAIESAVFLKAAYLEHIPVRLVHSHGVHDIESENVIRQRIDRKYISWIRKYATKCLGDSARANATHYGTDHEAWVINVPYDEVRFDPALYKPREKSDSIRITQVGQYCPNKNQLFTIKVFSEIVKLHPDAQLNFVGFDSIGFLPKMNEEIQRYCLQDKIKFYPHDTNIPLLLSQSDAFMFPSYTEGFGIAAVEAQAMGVRCYASDTIPLTTNCGGCTYLSLSLDPREWAEIILNDFINGDARTVYDCSAFKSAAVKEEYRRIYSGLM